MPEVQEAKIPRSFHSPHPLPTLSPHMTWVTATLIYFTKPIISPWRKGSNKVKWEQGEVTAALTPTHPRTHAPGAQLILAPPDKIAELLIVSVVVVLDSKQHGGRDFHQRVVGSLLLLAAGIPIVQIVDLVGYL